MRFTIYQESRQGGRSNNEDRTTYCYSRDALLMVIADGMGGLGAATVVTDADADTLTVIRGMAGTSAATHADQAEALTKALDTLEPARFAAVTAALYSGLGALVLVWAWRGAWFDAYDAVLWLAAFATIEMNVLGAKETG